jgi:hypothetical protein
MTSRGMAWADRGPLALASRFGIELVHGERPVSISAGPCLLPRHQLYCHYHTYTDEFIHIPLIFHSGSVDDSP